MLYQTDRDEKAGDKPTHTNISPGNKVEGESGEVGGKVAGGRQAAHIYPNTSPTHLNTLPTHLNTLTTHRRTSTPHPHTSPPHPHTSPPHPHTSPPHPHTSPPHPHTSPPHTHTSPPHTHTSPTHTHTSPTHLHTSNPHHVTSPPVMTSPPRNIPDDDTEERQRHVLPKKRKFFFLEHDDGVVETISKAARSQSPSVPEKAVTSPVPMPAQLAEDVDDSDTLPTGAGRSQAAKTSAALLQLASSTSRPDDMRQPPTDMVPIPGKVLPFEEGKCVCNICKKEFQKQSQLRIHYNIHYIEKPYRCDNCGLSFRSDSLLMKHKRSDSHLSKVNRNLAYGVATSENPRPFKCTDCNKEFRIHGHLAKHYRSKSHVTILERLGKVPEGSSANWDPEQPGDLDIEGELEGDGDDDDQQRDVSSSCSPILDVETVDDPNTVGVTETYLRLAGAIHSPPAPPSPSAAHNIRKLHPVTEPNLDETLGASEFPSTSLVRRPVKVPVTFTPSILYNEDLTEKVGHYVSRDAGIPGPARSVYIPSAPSFPAMPFQPHPFLSPYSSLQPPQVQSHGGGRPGMVSTSSLSGPYHIPGLPGSSHGAAPQQPQLSSTSTSTTSGSHPPVPPLLPQSVIPTQFPYQQRRGEQDELGLLRCDMCNFIARDEMMLRIHVISHLNPPGFPLLQQMPTAMASASLLQPPLHTVIQRVNKYVCERCDSTFGSVQELKLHKHTCLSNQER